jgi:endonuclease/exonuclease/phosphatase family metal-dependent hydrolase
MLLPAGLNSLAAAAKAQEQDRTLSVVSLNMAKEKNPAKVVNAIQAAPRLRDADLFLLQEVVHARESSSVAEEAARRLGYFSTFAAAPQANDQGLAIISRYPIGDIHIQNLKACDLRFRCRSRFALTATVATPWNPVRIWNVHLDTRINASERMEQLSPIFESAVGYTGPRLIGGDFNTNDLYWLGNVLPLPFGPAHSVSLRTAMKQHGFETPFHRALDTYPPFRRHLDWIFLSGLAPSAASVERAPFSDHHAIWVRAGL